MKRRSNPKETIERKIWRVFCRLGSGHVAGSCGHSHRTLVHAMRCSYEPVAYVRDPEAELIARRLKIGR